MALQRCLCILKIINQTYIFIGDIAALKDCWLVGDVFLNEMTSVLQDWRSDAVSHNETSPYLYEQYNVTYWYKSVLDPDPRAVRLFNSFMDGLNSDAKLPRYIIIFPEDDIIRGTRHIDFGITCILEETLDWMFFEMVKNIKRRRDDLKTIRAGALSSIFEPRLIWVGMIDRPEPEKILDKKVLGLRRRFNEMLCNYISKERYMYFLNPYIPLTSDLFTNDAKLSSVGKLEYWSEINNQIRLFEKNENELLPVVQKSDSNNKKNIKPQSPKEQHKTDHRNQDHRLSMVQRRPETLMENNHRKSGFDRKIKHRSHDNRLDRRNNRHQHHSRNRFY